MATFFAVYPDAIAWLNDRDGGADVVLFGQVDPAPINVDAAVEELHGVSLNGVRHLHARFTPSSSLGAARA